MNRSGVILERQTPTLTDSAPSCAVRFGRWLNRPRRVLLTLAMVWVVAIFDLGFTLSEWGSADFAEMNPLAVRVLSTSPAHVIVFKFGLLSFGSAILLAVRCHAVAELACWFLLTSKIYVAIRWYCYYDCLLNDYVNPLIYSQ